MPNDEPTTTGRCPRTSRCALLRLGVATRTAAPSGPFLAPTGRALWGIDGCADVRSRAPMRVSRPCHRPAHSLRGPAQPASRSGTRVMGRRVLRRLHPEPSFCCVGEAAVVDNDPQPRPHPQAPRPGDASLDSCRGRTMQGCLPAHETQPRRPGQSRRSVKETGTAAGEPSPPLADGRPTAPSGALAGQSPFGATGRTSWVCEELAPRKPQRPLVGLE